MIDASIRLAVLALAVEWGTRRLRRTSPAAAHALWMLVLAAAVALPIATVLVPPVAFVHPAGRLGALFPTEQTAAAWRRVAWPIYLAGASIAMARIAVGLLMIGRLVRRSRPVAPDRAGNPNGGTFAGRRRVALLEAPYLRVPVTVGFLRPKVLLPPDWRDWPAARLGAVMRHELAHVRRADYLSGVVGAVVQAAFWFHPAVWLAVRRAAVCAELASDRAAAGGDADYPQHLLALAAPSSQRLRYGWSVGATTALTERIEVLIAGEPAARSRTRVAVLGCALLVGGLVAATPLRMVPARRQAPPASFAEIGQAQHLHQHSHQRGH